MLIAFGGGIVGDVGGFLAGIYMTGIPVVTAQDILSKVGLKTAIPTFADIPISPVGTGDAQPVPPVAPGTVIAQQPLAGARVDQSIEVKLTVAK